MDDDYDRSIGYRLIHAARLQRALTARLLADLDLFPGQETVLERLDVSDGMTMSELAQVLRVRPPTVSKTIGRLAQQGLVERHATDDDARRVRVYLTTLGRERAAAVAGLWRDIEDAITRDLDGKDRRRLRKLLRKVETNLSEVMGGGAPAEDEDDEG